MSDLPFDATDPRLAAAAWTRIAEPGDAAAGLVRAAMGPGEALGWLGRVARGGEVPARHPAVEQLAPGLDPQKWAACVQRWLPRLERLDIRRELGVLDSLGGRLVVPDDDEWPTALADLGTRAPAALWVRGTGRLDAPGRAVSVVGMRASTSYGEQVAAQLGIDLAEHGLAVVSGGAYGIDAAAHRGTLSADGTTWAVLAGGIDRLYPVGNTALLEAIEATGVVLSEAPPGSVPSRHRFLERNRLIAALGSVCVVVEAAWRSGALSTARQAAELFRPVAVVPGAVTSMASVGCHRLLRETDAVCVTGSEDVLELLAPAGEHLPTEHAVQPGLLDHLDPFAARLLDAMPARGSAGPGSIARAGGLSLAEVRSGLGRLELAGRVQRHGSGWRRVPSRPSHTLAADRQRE